MASDFYHGECIGGHMDGQHYASLTDCVEVVEQDWHPCVGPPGVEESTPFHLPLRVVGHYWWKHGAWWWDPPIGE
jgi:hypothetical protein